MWTLLWARVAGWRVPRWGWWLLAVLACACGVVLGVRSGVRWIRADERRVVQQAADSSLRDARAASAAIAAERDTLRAQAVIRDSLLQVALAQGARVIRVPVPVVPTSLSDTTTTRRALDALSTALRTCRDTLDGVMTACEAVRQTAEAERDASARQHEADSTALAQQARVLIGIQRSRDDARAQLARRSRWQTAERTVCAVSLGANVFQWRSRR